MQLIGSLCPAITLSARWWGVGHQIIHMVACLTHLLSNRRRYNIMSQLSGWRLRAANGNTHNEPVNQSCRHGDAGASLSRLAGWICTAMRNGCVLISHAVIICHNSAFCLRHETAFDDDNINKFWCLQQCAFPPIPPLLMAMPRRWRHRWGDTMRQYYVKFKAW